MIDQQKLLKGIRHIIDTSGLFYREGIGDQYTKGWNDAIHNANKSFRRIQNLIRRTVKDKSICCESEMTKEGQCLNCGGDGRTGI